MGGLGWNPSWSENAMGQYDYNGVSQNPSMATGWEPSLSSAEQAWFQSNPSYAQYNTGGDAMNGPQTAGGPGSQAINPATNNTSGLSGLFDPQQMAGMQPLPFSAFGSIPYMSPATYSASNYGATGYSPATYGASDWKPQNVNLPSNAFVDPSTASSFLNQNMGLLQQQMDPVFQQQKQGLDESMAARGLFNSGGAVQAQNDLTRQQDSALAGAQEPLVAQGMGYQQQDVTGNASLRAQGAFQDALTGNQAGQFNAGQQTATAAQNAGFENAAASQNATAANQAGQFDAGANNQAGATNSAAANVMNQYNAGNYLTATGGDQAAYNNFLATLMGQGGGYGSNLMNAFLGSYGGANPQALNTIGSMPSMQMQYGQNAYNNALQNTSGLGSAFTDVFNGLFKKNAAGGGGMSGTPSGAPQNTGVGGAGLFA